MGMSKHLLIGLVAMMLPALGHSAVVWDEAVNGDLSGDRFNPTQLTLSNGSNLLLATTGDSELDFYTFTLAPNQQLSQLNLRAYNRQDVMFIGVTTGTTFGVDPNDPNIPDLLGWMHFGPANLDQDLLPMMGTGEFGAQGFTPPLGPGSYSFWMNQFNEPTSYTLEFVVTPVPEPATMAVLGLGVAAFIRRRRKN